MSQTTTKNKAKTFLPFSQKQLLAKYDAAQTSHGNMQHWANADALSPVAANSPSVRNTLRKRARYEYLNNCYCSRMVRTLASNVVGTMPHVQVQDVDEKIQDRIQRDFSRWAKEVKLPRLLRQAERSRIVDGESFAFFSTNPKIRHRVKLNVSLIEADRVCSPVNAIGQDVYADGIFYDSYGNPTSYSVLKEHPGDVTFIPGKSFSIDAKYMVHWFIPERAEQERGIPIITPALPLFAQLRRYTLAVISAAETAANFTTYLQTQSMPDDGADSGTPFDLLEITKDMITQLPEGWQIEQLKAEQPSTTYSDFVRTLLREIAASLEMPLNIAIGDSARYNYASGRLDHQQFFKSLTLTQAEFAEQVLNKIFYAWLEEASAFTPEYKNISDKINIEWIHDGHEHVDPAKEAAAQEKRLANHTTSLKTEYARRGKDWRKELEQIKIEKETMREFGIDTGDENQNEFDDEDDEPGEKDE